MSFDPLNAGTQDDDDEIIEENTETSEFINLDSSLNMIDTLKEKLIAKKLIRGYENEEKNKILFSGLPYMLENEYFNNAYILHDESEINKDLNEILLETIKNDKTRNLKELKNLFENTDKILSEDRRAELHRKWANLGYMLRFQPLSIIKNYYGEQITLYYSFVGVLISTLWIVVLAGIAVFIMGVIDKYINLII